MINIESEADLFHHLKNMKKAEPVSTIKIPGVGTFKLLLEDIDDPDREKKIQEEKSKIIVGEEFSDWEMVLELLKRDIPPAPFETWLKSTWAIKIKDQHLCINCSNTFQMDWVQKNYYSKILSKVEKVTGREYFLEFQVLRKD
ncbi:DnaA N-terminal domain-containing protein [Psychrobacillus sp. NPDC093180]|uniref:DnaA N-terminal domain-containing protein n=1 Tax=Psychrobacillus sp. NPDC093180 TaxID=3364489 RepID=UPI0037F20D24